MKNLVKGVYSARCKVAISHAELSFFAVSLNLC